MSQDPSILDGLTEAELAEFHELDRTATATLRRGMYAVILLEVATAAVQICLCLHGWALYRSSDPIMKARRRRSVIFSFTLLAIFLAYTVVEAATFPGVTFETNATVTELYMSRFANGPTADILASGILGISVVAVADAFILYRCYCIMKDHRFRKAVTAILMVNYISATVMSAASIAVQYTPYEHSGRINVAWVSLSAMLSTVASVIIVVRLYNMKRRIGKALEGGLLVKYTGVLAIVVESALPLTVIGICAVVLYAIPREEVAYTAIGIIPSVHVCAAAMCPQLIVFRVATGSSHTDDLGRTDTKPISQLFFAPQSAVDSEFGSVTIALVSPGTTKYYATK